MKKNYFLFNDGIFKLREISVVSNPKKNYFYRLKLDTTDYASDEETTESQIFENIAIDNACPLNDIMVYEINSMEEASEYIQVLESQQEAVLIGLIPVN